MAAKKEDGKQPEQVRKSLMVDPAKLAQAREVLGVASDAEVLRIALDRLLEQHAGRDAEEE